MRGSRQHLLILAVVLVLLNAPWPTSAVRGQKAQDADPRAVIVGKVVDEAKRPVAGATVTAFMGKRCKPVQSGLDGSFRVPVDHPEREWIYATLLVQGPTGRLGFLGVSQRTPAPVEVIVKAPRDLAVRVLDGAGKPVGGAAVRVLGAYSPIARGQTDADGRWAGRIPADATQASHWGIYAFKGKVGFDYLSPERYGGSGEEAALPGQANLKLAGARTLHVKTVDQHGKPVAGVRVAPWYIETPGHGSHVNLSGAEDVWLTTNQDGVAVFDWLPEHFVRGLPSIVHSDDYYVADHSTSISAKNPAAELTIPLLSFERLSGRVTYADGKPAAGIRVRAQGQGAGHSGFHGAARTDADGRYALRVHAEEAYVVAAGDERWAAPHKGGLVIRAGKPVTGVDFVLGPATRLHGFVTLGKENRPAPDVPVDAVINLGHIPPELRKKGDRVYHQVGMTFSTETRKDGRYELFLGPGTYEVSGPIRAKMVKITIPAENQPAEIVHDFLMPRPETGPLAGRVVDGKGQPIAGAVVQGYYASHDARRRFPELKSGADGRFQCERSLDPLVIRARMPNGKEAGIARIGADAATVEIVVRPVATAAGRLLDFDGKSIAQAKLRYGIRIYMGEEENSPFMTAFGGVAVADDDGRFTLKGLIPGQKYSVDREIDDHRSAKVTEITPKTSEPIALGDLKVNRDGFKRYVPPTPAEVAKKAFTPAPVPSAWQRQAKLLTEARREYTRPLLLFGRPRDAACIDLFRLFEDRPEPTDKKDKLPRHTPSSLRWEFELGAFDIDQPEVRKLAEKLGVTVGKTPILAALNPDGSLAATYPLSLGKDDEQDAAPLTAFLLKHKRPQRDAERMLAEALKTAKAEDKRVFFIASASWCGPCRKLGRFLDPWQPELRRHYVFVKLDISRDEHAQTVTKRLRGDRDGGVPWYAILDPDAKVLITSNAPEVKRFGKPANIGFPSETPSVDHFIRMLTQTAPRLTGRHVVEIRAQLFNKE